MTRQTVKLARCRCKPSHLEPADCPQYNQAPPASAMDPGHIADSPSPSHPVECTARSDGSTEWTTVAYAVSRLAGYYDDDPDGWIEATIRGGTTLQTMSFLYRIPTHVHDPHDCEPTDDGTACRICGAPAERDDITPAELVALIASQP